MDSNRDGSKVRLDRALGRHVSKSSSLLLVAVSFLCIPESELISLESCWGTTQKARGDAIKGKPPVPTKMTGSTLKTTRLESSVR